MEDRPMKSGASTAQEYLAELPDDRRAVVSAVRDVVVRNLPDGYEESVGFGMLNYTIPLERYPNTYNKQPLSYVALAAQKNYYSLYLTGAYMDAERTRSLADEFERAGKKLDMGKSCVRFKKLDDLPLDVIGRAVASTPPDDFIAQYEASRRK
jgi:hypothetical protein